MNLSNFKLVTLTFVAMVLWGLSWTNAKILGNYGDASLMMFWRFVFATISFAPVVVWNGNPFKLPKTSLRFIIINAIFMTSYNFFYFKGTQTGLAGTGGILVSTLNPILTAVFATLIFRDIMPKKNIIGLFLGLCGGGIIMRLWDSNADQLMQSGNLFFLLASISWVAVTLNTSRIKYRVSFIPYSFWCFFFASIFSFPMAMGNSIMAVFTFDWIFWLNMMLVSVGAMAYGTSIYFLASVELGAQKASAFIFTVPITAMGFAMIFLNEKLTITTLLGGSLTMTAVYLINKK
ncbi:MAG TPA: DMT family transporter [Candidatus Marinimicrobia bacterium]|nr:DMT family transporter [Candidatus Neomarinimicrobiota bacterium]